MATLGDLLELVQDKLQDTAYDDDKLTAVINTGIRRVANVILLPELEVTGTFDTDPLTTSVVIPVNWNYCRGIYSAHPLCTMEIDPLTGLIVIDPITGLEVSHPIATEYHPQVLSSMGLLRAQAHYVDTEVRQGEIDFLTTRRGMLVYTPSPRLVTRMLCKFYENPPALVDDDEIPTCIPEVHHESLLVNFALWRCFEEVEDGIEGDKVNTAYYKNEFNEALAELDLKLETGRSVQDPYRESQWI